MFYRHQHADNEYTCKSTVISTPDTQIGFSENSVDTFLSPHGKSAKFVHQNHKPKIENCQNYKPSVKEEQPGGTYVTTVTAIDDDPREGGGTISYKLIHREGEHVLFDIDNVTGVLTTIQPFDRDEPVRQKELYVTVQASDNGRPPLADVCTFTVTITDINDNAPQLDKLKYDAQVSEDLKVGSEVMRVFAYDIDDGENSRLSYNFSNENAQFTQYFRIDRDTGVVYLKEALTDKKNTRFNSAVYVADNGVNDQEGQKDSTAKISITVVGSDKQPPRFTQKMPDGILEIPEDFKDFSKHIVTVEATSNIADPQLAFELVKGKTYQTNKDQTFLLEAEGNKAHIKLVRPLDYETVTEYTLTIRVKNKDLMDSSINIPIKVLDVNDEIPNFLEFLKGSVVENDKPGAQAIQVRAIDKDGTAANNIVSYELVDNTDLFAINRSTGVITSRVEFDRETVPLYHVNVKAYDNSPSALYNTTLPNIVIQTFQISIEDQNDNKPVFTHPIYQFSNITELADKSSIVGEVKALDNDTASVISYSITNGNIDDAFMIENSTGRIRVNGKLDYEKIEQYNLTVRAFDGAFEDFAIVLISILNENDEPPVFDDYIREIQIKEEEPMISGCVVRVTAHDPDIKDRHADQHIVYEVAKEQKDFLTVSADGCVQVTKPLDRDPPFGSPTRQVFIYARDNDGGTNSLLATAEIEIILIDINDNAPFLNVTEIVYYENQDPGFIGNLSADDYDGPDNGPPFAFRLSDTASDSIRSKFSIIGNQLFALEMFDREEQKYYDIAIDITDSGVPPLTGTSILRVIIGDVNDNPATDGNSTIFVYKYVNGPENFMEIGRVYVTDLDDWDLNDKVFVQEDNFEEFVLNQHNNGMILMKPTTAEGTYEVHYRVTETHEPTIHEHTVNAIVTITVKVLPEEAVVKSGSIRLRGTTKEEFIENSLNGKSKRDILHQELSKILNTSLANVDVFTVLNSPHQNSSFVDVRFSAHGSPYYAPEKLENKVTDHQMELEQKLDVEFYMINVNECLNETTCGAENSCTNKLNITREPAVVFTNRTSFVGVNAFIDPVCAALPRDVMECFNGGVLIENTACNCPAGFEGPHCEILAIGFTGTGWAMYPSFDATNRTEIILHILSQTDNGLIFYNGPLNIRQTSLSKDYISLELKDGYPLLQICTGSSTQEIYLKERIHKLSDGSLHKIKIGSGFDDISLEVDDCGTTCSIWTNKLHKGVIRANGPLQLGGMKNRFTDQEFKRIWDHLPPTATRFSGCIRNLTYNEFYYNLGAPSDAFQAYPDCNYAVMQAVTFGIDSNFLVAILVCVAILIILLLAVVVHRRKHDNFNEKEIDDTRENIINYEDEGGGECDTNYDLSVFHQNNIVDEKPLMRDNPDVPADISGFLDNKKDNCDKDPDNLPYDDVRHYAYEGDGNSTGSLSSLASCTDEGDLKFNYLSSFGPRFRKLADMYGEDPSDEDSHDGNEESWC
ncbi:DE-cadherin isoform X2 [Diabrotica virgifera virgifera]|uniref:DE-cadherin n=1 Tax=Diabrotica virgifera virgifera TaxID=50390 RepID=A0ABM5LAI7_DIAVI|nr:DE-cadherin isoform X2 [Diabrotica virgifera virgifera]